MCPSASSAVGHVQPLAQSMYHCAGLSSSGKHRGVHVCESVIVGITGKYGGCSGHVNDEEWH